ncbi:heterokaryon incompatibility protein-domain-containing protein, partial [Halenospora varia]
MIRDLVPSTMFGGRYQYSELQDATKMIRLLKLEAKRTKILCEMIQVPLHSLPAYDAISYTWGDPDKFRTLNISGRYIAITRNIQGILRDLAPLKGVRYIWIDSLCINQEDDIEKGEQVQLMREIYQNAEKTVVWLGDAPDASTATEFTTQLAAYLYRKISLGEPMVDHMPFKDQAESWIAFQRLLNHPYWSRVWIIQEVASAKTIEILYGGNPLYWDIFSLTVSSFMTTKDHALVLLMNSFPGDQKLPMDGISFISKLFYLRRRSEEKLLPITELLIECAQSAATMPQDKVIALLGISDAASEPELKPDYTKPFEEVFIETVLYTLKCQCFSLLTMGGIYSTKSEKGMNLPSWVPDLSNPTTLYPLENGKSTYQAGTGRAPSFSRVPGSNVLKIKGVLFDKIKKVAEIPPSLTLPDNMCKAPGFSYEQTIPGVNAQEYTRHKEIHTMVQQYIDELYHNNQERNEALWRTVIGDETTTARPAEYSIEDDYQNYLDFQEILKRGPDGARFGDMDFILRNQESFNRINQLMGRKITARQFAVTEKKYMALVPLGTREGDWIAVFCGAATPHVLRPKHDTLDQFEVFGDAYVHGLMDGEVFNSGDAGR